MGDIIHIDDFSYAIGTVQILQGITLTVREGEYAAIIGPNGAGKSTLLKCIMRILKGGSSTIELNGKPLDTYSQRALARLVSYIPQQDISGLHITVEEFLLMSRYPHLSPFTTIGDSDRKAVAEALAITGCERFATRYLMTLSGGERRTVSIAAALAQESRIMLLDEPTAFLDPRHERDIFALIGRINRELGRSVLMVTHDINHAAMSCDHIVILHDGQCVFSGEPHDMMTNEVLAPVYGTSFTFLPHPANGFPVIMP